MIIFFGWGKKGSEVALSPTQRLVLRYTYFHVFWFLTATWGRGYQVATWTEQGWALQPVTAAHADALCGGTAPDVSAWKQYSLIGAASLFVVVMALSLTLSG